MTMNVTGASDAVITRRGQEITAGEDGDPPEPCVGTIPTASNTDTINVLFTGDHPGAEAQVLLAGGPLAPGATAGAAGAPEIEIQVSGNGSAVSVVGTRGDDRFRRGPAPCPAAPDATASKPAAETASAGVSEPAAAERAHRSEMGP